MTYAPATHSQAACRVRLGTRVRLLPHLPLLARPRPRSACSSRPRLPRPILYSIVRQDPLARDSSRPSTSYGTEDKPHRAEPSLPGLRRRTGRLNPDLRPVDTGCAHPTGQSHSRNPNSRSTPGGPQDPRQPDGTSRRPATPLALPRTRRHTRRTTHHQSFRGRERRNSTMTATIKTTRATSTTKAPQLLARALRSCDRPSPVNPLRCAPGYGPTGLDSEPPGRSKRAKSRRWGQAPAPKRARVPDLSMGRYRIRPTDEKALP